jgi:hypothetical protein
MEPEVREAILKRVDQRQARTPFFLVLIGVALAVLAALEIAGLDLPEWRGALTMFCLGALFVYVAALIHERQRLARSFHELLEAHESFLQTVYGKDYKKHRAAVDILIGTLGTDNAEVRRKVHEQLRRITGQTLPAEPGPWEAWWKENKASFTLDRGGGGR